MEGQYHSDAPQGADTHQLVDYYEHTNNPLDRAAYLRFLCNVAGMDDLYYSRPESTGFVPAPDAVLKAKVEKGQAVVTIEIEATNETVVIRDYRFSEHKNYLTIELKQSDSDYTLHYHTVGTNNEHHSDSVSCEAAAIATSLAWLSLARGAISLEMALQGGISDELPTVEDIAIES